MSRHAWQVTVSGLPHEPSEDIREALQQLGDAVQEQVGRPVTVVAFDTCPSGTGGDPS